MHQICLVSSLFLGFCPVLPFLEHDGNILISIIEKQNLENSSDLLLVAEPGFGPGLF
jgi:hypothetical protein